VGVSDDDVIDLLQQRRRSGPPVIAELSRAQLVEVRREDGCGVALNRELAASNRKQTVLTPSILRRGHDERTRRGLVAH
jgi:hypothetical protein